MSEASLSFTHLSFCENKLFRAKRSREAVWLPEEKNTESR